MFKLMFRSALEVLSRCFHSGEGLLVEQLNGDQFTISLTPVLIEPNYLLRGFSALTIHRTKQTFLSFK